MSFLFETVVFLCAAVITVPLFSRLGLGSILGYLIAGLLIGPHTIGLIGNPDDVLHFAEFGVVLLLFLIGLEMQPTRLWSLRRPIFGLGSAQIALSALFLTPLAMLVSPTFNIAILIAVILSLSSTAIAAQTLADKGHLRTRHGRITLSILLFQDITVIPLLALIPLLGRSFDTVDPGLSVVDFIVAGTAIAAVVAAGKFVIEPLLKLVASSGHREIFTASALLVVVGTAFLMESIGLSMALGAFLAGVLLSESGFRHALEADIEPFKGLLMGLFFIAVGMSVDPGLLIDDPFIIIVLVVGIIVMKGMVLIALGHLTRLGNRPTALLTAYLAQGGEFDFVLFAAAASANVIEPALASKLMLVVTLSMMITPLLFYLVEKYSKDLEGKEDHGEFDKIEHEGNRVIIAGFGRVGQIIARTLTMKNIAYTALDSSGQQVSLVRRFGNKAYFGDATRPWLLRAAGAEHADVLVLAVEDAEESIRIAEVVKANFPHIRIYARARNRQHAYRLIELGVDRVVRETLDGSLQIAVHTLQGLGVAAAESHEVADRFREHDEALLYRQAQIHDDEDAIVQTMQEATEQLENLLEQDQTTSEEAD